MGVMGVMRLAVIMALVASVTGCRNLSPRPVKPIVSVVTPADGARYDTGETIHFTVAAAASANVKRIELSINGNVVVTEVNPTPSPTFSSRISYTPRFEGRIVFSVVAVDTAGTSSEPFALSIVYGVEPTPEPTATLEPIFPAGPVTDANGCKLSASFLQDVNVPDGTMIRAGALFTKTWRLKNTSSCDWGEGFSIAYLSDTPMSVADNAPVRPTPSNANVDIDVRLTAPSSPGIYTSTWRLKDPAGEWFGNRIFVVIHVP